MVHVSCVIGSPSRLLDAMTDFCHVFSHHFLSHIPPEHPNWKMRHKKHDSSACVRQTWPMVLGRPPAPNCGSGWLGWKAPPALFSSPCWPPAGNWPAPTWTQSANTNISCSYSKLVCSNKTFLTWKASWWAWVVGKWWCVASAWVALQTLPHPRKGRAHWAQHRPAKGLRSRTISFLLLYSKRGTKPN